MLSRRVIPCLDVRHGQVVKGVRFQDHQVVGELLELARRYRDQGADELVFYDITASPEGRVAERQWVLQVARELDIPFCVAGGIRSIADAEAILHAGADKISINSPALENPELINALVAEFGSQCVVIGIDSVQDSSSAMSAGVLNQALSDRRAANHSPLEMYSWQVKQYTGDVTRMRSASRRTLDWITEVQDRGAGEIVLNCMGSDGVRQGYDLPQLQAARALCNVPLIASGGAGSIQDFVDVFQQTDVDGALAASVFHANAIAIPALKTVLRRNQIEVRDANG